MKAVLVGGGGFIGHHTALEMAKRGWKPTIMDSFGINNLYALEPGPSLDRSMIQERIRLLNAVGVPIVQVDARNYELLSQNISWVKPDVILHFAAVSHIDRSNKSPRTTLDHSLRTLENSLDIARALECRLIYFSSSTVYGDWEEEFVTEETLCKPKGIYGRMKLAGELLVDGYHEVFDLPTVIIRPCALYGPRCISRRVTQIFVENALLRKPITMQGGGQMTDFTCVDDLVEGIMLCCEREFAAGQTFNITGGKARSLSNLLDIIDNLVSVTDVTFTDPDAEKPRRGTMLNAKAENLLGYKPKHTLETGIEKYVRWYEEFLNRQE